MHVISKFLHSISDVSLCDSIFFLILEINCTMMLTFPWPVYIEFDIPLQNFFETTIFKGLCDYFLSGKELYILL